VTRPDDAGVVLDLDAYLRQIDYRGDLAPTRAALDALHVAHATHIPFENLDVVQGRPIRLDLASLQAKLVGAARGGYCFEQNLLFAAVLERLGFAVTRLAARVRLGTADLLPRTHMMLLVAADGERWVADVGFGAAGFLAPVPFGSGAEARRSAWRHRVAEEAGGWVMQACTDAEWRDLYAFTLEPQLPVDYEIANYYTSTHPASRFVRTLTVQRLTPDVRHTLRDREYIEEHGATIARRTVADDDEVLALLATTFGLSLPSGTPLGRIACAT